jgi:hypothetical protein
MRKILFTILLSGSVCFADSYLIHGNIAFKTKTAQNTVDNIIANRTQSIPGSWMSVQVNESTAPAYCTIFYGKLTAKKPLDDLLSDATNYTKTNIKSYDIFIYNKSTREVISEFIYP